MIALPFTKAARERKRAKMALAAARTFVLSYEDLPEWAGRAEFKELGAAWAAKDAGRCSELLAELDAPKSFAFGREWLDILVVSISVAMAFRAYFYEPFNIPTGSMQPTLYGNHSEECSPVMADPVWDLTPLKWLKWLVTGRMFEDFRAPATGQMLVQPLKTGYYRVGVNTSPKTFDVPADAFMPQSANLKNGLAGHGAFLRAGQRIWSGYVVTGDFLFVNRWLWNFRHPRRGDVMIFSTTGIERLDQGTHYIKRMTALPGEKIEIVEPDVFIDGKKLPPLKPMVGRYGEQTPVPRPEVMQGPVVLGEAEYFACGDNSASSYDSRYWGPVPAANLRGVAGGVFWPFSRRWGVVK